MNQFSNVARGVDAATALVWQKMPEMPSYIFQEGHAEHYRNVAWVAAISGHRWIALRLVSRAIYHYCPWIFWYKWRLIVSLFAAIILPTSLIAKIQRFRGKSYPLLGIYRNRITVERIW
jgi:hypothetical protein